MSRIRMIKKITRHEFYKLTDSERRAAITAVTIYSIFCEDNPEIPIIPPDIFIKERVFDFILSKVLKYEYASDRLQ